MVQSTDRLQTVQRNKPSGADSVGFYAAFDTNTPAGQPSKLYLATANRDSNIGGEVFLYDPSTTNWTNLNLGPLVSDKRPIALAVGHHAADSSTVVLAAVQESGVWRKQGTAGWEQVLPSTAPGGPLSSSSNNTDGMTWVANSKVAYLADGPGGLWRTNDEGNTGSWLEIWNHTAEQVAANPNDPSILYVSTGSGVYALGSIADGDTVENKGITQTTVLAGMPTRWRLRWARRRAAAWPCTWHASRIRATRWPSCSCIRSTAQPWAPPWTLPTTTTGPRH